jgi:hypothetical protein
MKLIALWLLAVALIAAGFLGVIAPGLPGVLLIFGGMLLGAWIDDFQRVGWLTLAVLAALMLLTFIIDVLASLLGAQRVGASRQALIGSVLGGLAGIPLGLVGLIAGPFVGAVIGEYLARRELIDAARVGWGTFVGLAVGTLAKLALAVAMLGIFAAALIW